MKQMREEIVWKELNICSTNEKTNDYIKMINPFEQYGQHTLQKTCISLESEAKWRRIETPRGGGVRFEQATAKSMESRKRR
jgi:hypothetical protein